jgi:signal transduction histidine kinase
MEEQAAVDVRNARLFADSRRRLRDMSALVDMAKQVTGKLKLQSVLQTTVQILRRLLNARASTITMLSEDGTELVVAAADGVDPRYVNKARMKVGEGVSGEVVKRCELVYVRDAHSEPDFLFFDEILRSLLVVPLVIRDEAIGTLTVDSDKPYAFSDSDIQLMTIAAAQASVAIANARLFEELEERAAELAIAYDELKESDRLKDELVQNVSHELRTPLTFVKGYVDLLMDGEMGLVTSEQLDALHIVSEKTDEITRIIDDIITLQRIDAGNLQLQVWSMPDLIRAAVAGHRMVAAKKGIDVICSLSPETGMVMADKGRINQVLDNLIGNAIKFSPNGGTINVEMYEQDDTVCVVVSDQGVGVPEEKQDRIFDRLYQADSYSRRRFGRTGNGLAIVKRIINAHRGRIWVESKVDQGSSFYFTLPRVSPELKQKEELVPEHGS